MLNKILDFIFPPKCAFCGDILTTKHPVCDKCMELLPFIDGDTCQCCGKPVEELSYRLCSQCNSEKRYFEHSFVPLRYEDDAKKAVLLFKHHYHPYYAKAFAFLICDKILSSEFYTDFDYITCVPESYDGVTERGYNQAELLAKEIAKILNVPFIHTLHRNDNGKKQASLNREERKKNVRISYSEGKKTYDDGTVLLVDDVYTTGETSNYCAKLLRKMGFDKVYLGISMIRINE